MADEKKEMMGGIEERVFKAVKRYLGLQGCTDICEYRGEIVCRDDDELVFVAVAFNIDGDGFPPIEVDRRTREQLAIAYLVDNEIADCKVRFDECALAVVGGDRALLRLKKNALGEE